MELVLQEKLRQKVLVLTIPKLRDSSIFWLQAVLFDRKENVFLWLASLKVKAVKKEKVERVSNMR